MLAVCSRPELEMLIKEFVLSWPHPSTVHAEKRKLNMVLYVMRYAGSGMQSMHQPQEQIALHGHRPSES